MSDYMLAGEVRRVQDGLKETQRIMQERSRDEARERNKHHKELMAIQRINTLALLASQGFTEAHDALTKNVTVDGLELSVLSDEACYALNLPKFHSDAVKEPSAADEAIRNAALELVTRHQIKEAEPDSRTYLKEENSEDPEEVRESPRASYLPNRLLTFRTGTRFG